MFYFANHKAIIWTSVLALFGALIVAALSATQVIAAAIVFSPLFVTIIGIAIWYLLGAKSGNLFVYICLIAIFLLPFSLKVAGIRLFGAWQIVLVLGGILGVPIFYRHAKTQPILIASLSLFAAYIAWASLSSFISGRFNAKAFSYQIISNIKPIFLIAFGFFAWDRLSSHKLLWNIVDYCAWVLLAFIAFEWILPRPYFSAFGAMSGMSVDTTGIFPSRAVGPFEHPSFLASVAACFGMLCAARAICCPRDRLKYSLLTLLYCVCLLCSVQRQELAGAVAGIFAMLFLAKNIKWSAWHLFAIVTAAALIPVGLLLFGADIYREAGTWGIGTIGEISHPRAQQYSAAFLVANSHFPFGTGLGTFGGPGAEKFDLSLYYELGFGRYWWFGKQDYLLDTYWPNSIAEGGWIGFALLLLHYCVLGWYCINNARKENDALTASFWLFAGIGVWFLIANAFSSPAFQDPRLFFWVAMSIAIAHYTPIVARHESIS